MNQKHLLQLRDKLMTSFNESELKMLCFELGIDHENLPDETKADLVRELLSWLQRNGRLSHLIELAKQKRPNQTWAYQASIFISYKRHAQPDNQLADALQQLLDQQGHKVFIDTTLRAGTAWMEEIDKQLKQAEFLIVLLSESSADSEMVQSEIQRAYEYRKRQGHPTILPIRVQYKGMLPYTIAAYLSQVQYVIWESEKDTERLGQEILAAIHGELPKRPFPANSHPHSQVLSEDGRLLTQPEAIPRPLPEFDPRLVESLIAPGGAVRLRDKFYVRRQADEALEYQVLQPGSITTIRAARQTGKSSLMVRGIAFAKQRGAKIITFDLQRLDRDYLTSPDAFLRYMADMLALKLGRDQEEVERIWQRKIGPQIKLTHYLETHILPQDETPLVLALDEVDRLLETDFHTDFFGLLRSWHNSAAYDELWERLNIVMVISTEPYLLIADINQSPFNVGSKLYLKDFTAEQVQALNIQHGSPITPEHFDQFMYLFNGHPYLTRKALYSLVAEEVAWADLVRLAPTEAGPFGDHLRRQLWLLQQEPELEAELKQLIRFGECTDDSVQFRLFRAGLISTTGGKCRFRCGLYHLYFKEKLT